mgnify:CR=1 FL=1
MSDSTQEFQIDWNGDTLIVSKSLEQSKDGSGMVVLHATGIADPDAKTGHIAPARA